MAGNERGNMRCFEAMGCGALMVSDRGIYPSGMSNGQTILTYENSVDAALVIERTLLNYSNTVKITHSALSLVRERYSKDNQFLDFIKILEFVK